MSIRDIIDISIHGGRIYYNGRYERGTVAHGPEIDITIKVQPDGYYRMTFSGEVNAESLGAAPQHSQEKP
jgi:hypothetical protein